MTDVVVAVGQAFAFILVTAVPVLAIGAWAARRDPVADASTVLPRAVARRRG